MVNNSKNAVRILQFARKRAPQAVAKLLFPWNWGKKQTNKREKKKKTKLQRKDHSNYTIN